MDKGEYISHLVKVGKIQRSGEGELGEIEINILEYFIDKMARYRYPKYCLKQTQLKYSLRVNINNLNLMYHWDKKCGNLITDDAREYLVSGININDHMDLGTLDYTILLPSYIVKCYLLKFIKESNIEYISIDGVCVHRR